MAQPTSSRLLSLDVLRGITIAGMITVNNPGSWSHIYAPLRHAAWNGLTHTDLVFPFFMFIMGVSMYLSYKKFDFKFSNQTFFKLLRRSVLLFLIGLGLNYFGLICRGFSSLREVDMGFGNRLLQVFIYNLENLRILGVLQRLALVSFFGSLTILIVKPKHIPWLIGGILVFYWILMVGSNSLEANATNLVAIMDTAILGASHMYKIGGIPFDPEGLLSTLPCIAHVLIGVTAGRIIDTNKDNGVRIQKLFILGSIILFIGFLMDYSFPINKTLWSSSYVLVTCGLALLLLGLLIWIIDINGKRKWCVFFESFGINPMAIFVLAGIISNLISNIGFTYAGSWTSIKGFIYNSLLVPVFGNLFGSLVFALLFIVLCWSIAHILYKKKIYIKI